jgi:hypothetical protein
MAKHESTTIKIPYFGETKNMVRYQFQDDQKNSSPLPNIYVGKSLFPGAKDGDYPAFLEVTVKGVDK